jgi:hypothetical protein
LGKGLLNSKTDVPLGFLAEKLVSTPDKGNGKKLIIFVRCHAKY